MAGRFFWLMADKIDKKGPYDFGDTEIVSQMVEDYYERFKRYRQGFERTWYRNILYLLGIQWVIWDEVRSKWRRRRMKSWVPTPVTNRFASSGARLASVLSRVDPNWIFVPGSDSEADIAAAEAAEQLSSVITEENDIESLREQVARWLVYTGNAYIEPGVEDSPNRGRRLYSDAISPFEAHADLSIPLIKDQECVQLIRRRDKEYIRALYGVDVDEDSSSSIGERYLESIGHISADLGLGYSESSRDERVPRATVKRTFRMPSEEWPEGIYAVKAGEKIVESMPLFAPPNGDPEIPIIQFKFDEVPGAFFGKTPMNDLAEKQTQRNRLESLIELITIRVSNPIWLVPQDVQVENFTGEPGGILKYSNIGDRNSAPSRIPGEQVPGSLFNLLEKYDEDFEEIPSLFDAIKGNAPFSGAPGVVVDRLIEQGMNRFGPTLRNIAEGYRKWMKIQLDLFRMHINANRQLSVVGENAKWKIKNFQAADINGAVNVRVEADSSVPRSESVNIARVLTAIQSGLVTLDDPMRRLDILKKLHLSDLAKTTDEDVVSAVREHDALLDMDPMEVQMLTEGIRASQESNGAVPMPGLPIEAKALIHNDDIHLQKHRSFALSEEGRPFEAILQVHMAEHMMNGQALQTPEGPDMQEEGAPAPRRDAPEIDMQEMGAEAPQPLASGF